MVTESTERNPSVAHLHFKSPEEIEEEDEFQDCLTVIQAESSSTSANNATIPTILTTAPPSAEDDAVPPAASWRRLRGVLSATAAAASRDAETGAAVKRRASVKGRWKSMRSRPQRERGSNVSEDLGTIHF